MSPRAARTAPQHFYTAGGGVTGFQNGLALAGDYMSAASFLGIAGLVALVRIRRPDLFHRVSRRLAGGDVPDRRAAAQSRSIHVRRRRRIQAAPGARARGGIGRIAGGHRVLSDRADGRRRQPHPAALRPPVRARRPHRRRRHAGVRAVRRHDGDDVGADRQGRAAPERRVPSGGHGAGPIRLQPARAVSRRGRHLRCGRARARAAGVESARCRVAGPVADVRHRRSAAHPDAVLHRARCHEQRAPR